MTGHKYKIGDEVIFTNAYGVCCGVKKITGLEIDKYTNSVTYLNGAPGSPLKKNT